MSIELVKVKRAGGSAYILYATTDSLYIYRDSSGDKYDYYLHVGDITFERTDGGSGNTMIMDMDIGSGSNAKNFFCAPQDGLKGTASGKDIKCRADSNGEIWVPISLNQFYVASTTYGRNIGYNCGKGDTVKVYGSNESGGEGGGYSDKVTITFTITFYDHYGDYISSDNYAYGATLTLPYESSVPTTGRPSATIYQDYNFNITIDPNGGTGGGTVAASARYKKTNTFQGWYDSYGDAVFYPGGTYTVYSDASLTAQYKESSASYYSGTNNTPNKALAALTNPVSRASTGTIYTVTLVYANGSSNGSLQAGSRTDYSISGFTMNGSTIGGDTNLTSAATIYVTWSSNTTNHGSNVTLPNPTKDSEVLNTYTVSFDGTVYYPTAIPSQISEVKKNYDFSGWYDSNGNKVTSPYTPTANISLTARYTSSQSQNSVTIPDALPNHSSNWGAGTTLELDGGTISGDTYIGTSLIHTFKFRCWSPDYCSTTVAAGSSYSPTADIKFTAYWDEISVTPETITLPTPTKATTYELKYTVTLNPDGGTVSSTTLAANDKCVHTFTGWYTSDGEMVNANAYVADDSRTLTARYSTVKTLQSVTLPDPSKADQVISTYNITYNPDGGDMEGNPTSVSIDKTRSFEFLNWKNPSNTVISSPFTPSEDITLKAYYDYSDNIPSVRPPEITKASAVVDTYTVTLDAEGANITNKILKSDVTRIYEYDGWYNAAGTKMNSYFFPDEILGGLDLTCRYIESDNPAPVQIPSYITRDPSVVETYVVTLNPDGGNLQNTVFNCNKTRSYAFDGWAYPNGDILDASVSYVPVEDITFLATYNYSDVTDKVQIPESITKNTGVVETYVATFDALGGTVESASISANKTRSYEFEGWYEGDTKLTELEYTPERTVTINAQYINTDVTDTITIPEASKESDIAYYALIHLSPRGGSVPETHIQNPVRRDYNFVNWVDESGATYEAGDVITPTSNLDMTVVYEEGDTTSPVFLPTPERKKATFIGWSTDPDYPHSGFVNTAISPIDNIDLYAYYKADAKVVPYVFSNGRWRRMRTSVNNNGVPTDCSTPYV